MSNDASTPVTPESTPRHRYDAELAGRIERRWQQRWRELRTFEAPNPVGDLAPADPSDVPADKLFVQDMFPYPSGAGLHVGHPLGYIATDVFARYHRMNGHNVLHTLGYDAFGLPAEQYAVQTGTHPRVTTEANIATMKRQLDRLGLGHDERRAVATTDTEFYRWTQWIFLQIYNAWYDHDPDRARPIAELEAAVRRRYPRAARGRTWDELSVARTAGVDRSLPAGVPVATHWSTGARGWARCWPTRRSPPTAAATAATSPCFVSTCGSG